ncbi:UNVERIFIED_CONTAM: hypothetical protein FKN15_003518 [Acipenser sinensis]
MKLTAEEELFAPDSGNKSREMPGSLTYLVLPSNDVRRCLRSQEQRSIPQGTYKETEQMGVGIRALGE